MAGFYDSLLSEVTMNRKAGIERLSIRIESPSSQSINRNDNRYGNRYGNRYDNPVSGMQQTFDKQA